MLVWIVVFLSSDVYLIFLVFQKQQLGNALLLLDTTIEVSWNSVFVQRMYRINSWGKGVFCWHI